GISAAHNGIFSTPVIDLGSRTMYVVAHVWSTADQSVALELHALDITTGSEKYGGPIQISAAGFDPEVNEQRAGLLLLNGIVYLPMGSYGDLHMNVTTQQKEPYVGLILA